jgi:tRNA pseudouridine38-40 synthase
MDNQPYFRYFVYLAYHGREFHGWQIQPNGISVQEMLEKAFSTKLKHPIAITGAGRTDTGVHAKMMVAHFDTHSPIENSNDLVSKLNSFLPKSIAIFSIKQVQTTAHARFDALMRTYQYHVTTQKNPFTTELSCKVPPTIQFEQMNIAAQKLLQYADFTSFSKLHTDVKTNICSIRHAAWTQVSDTEWVFTIQADRFLRNMVRAIVGTLFDVGNGKISIDEFCAIIEQKNRCAAGTSVPAHALFLVDIAYPTSIFV